MAVINVPAWYYSQFDADYSLNVPAEGYGGWKKAMLPLDTESTAFTVMHAWDCGTPEQYPGWYRAVEYIPRAADIGSSVLPKLLQAIREKGMMLIHIADDSQYAKSKPGYDRTMRLMSGYAEPPAEDMLPVRSNDTLAKLKAFRSSDSFVGTHNESDIAAGRLAKDFMPGAMPLESEYIVKDSTQLHAVCLEHGINHLIYSGFAINWCLQHSPGNMNEMRERGCLCSAIREAVTAVENKESAATEAHKEYGLWRTALANGFIYDLEDVLKLLAV